MGKRKADARSEPTASPMRKSDKPMWQGATRSTRRIISIPPKPRAMMEYDIKKPAGYTGI